MGWRWWTSTPRPSSGSGTCRSCPATRTRSRSPPTAGLVAFGREDEILVLDVQTLADVTSWPTDPYDNPFGFAWLDAGATLAHGGIQGRLAFRSIPDGQPIGEPREVAPGFTLDLATNTDATRLATLGTDGEIILWDPVTKQAVGEPLVPNRDRSPGAGSGSAPTIGASSSRSSTRTPGPCATPSAPTP